MTDYEDALKKSSLGAEALIESVDPTRVDAIRSRLNQETKAELNTTQRSEEDVVSVPAEFRLQAATRAGGDDASIVRVLALGSAPSKIEESPLDSELPERGLAVAHLADLMAKSALGDHGAFGELYDLTVRRIHSVALRVLRSPEHAEEVTQEVYVEVWQQSARYTPAKGSVLAWIATMAHRRAVDRVRSVSSEVSRDHRFASESVDPEVDRVWDRVAQNHDVDRVRAAMQALTPIQREALTLAYFEGLTQSQIADRLDVPLGTVKTRIRDALKKLAEILGGDGP